MSDAGWIGQEQGEQIAFEGVPGRTADRQTSPSGLRVLLLGAPEIRWAGELVPVARRQLRGLLYFLAAQPEPIPRDRLSALFWSELPDSLARRNLARLLHQLRTALPDSGLLHCNAENIALDPQRVWCDVQELERLCSRPDPAHPLMVLERVAGMFRGEFLSGFSLAGSPDFDDWLSSQRRAIERRYLQALEEALELLAARANYGQAIQYAQRYLAVDEFAERIHRRLIELYALTGQREKALRQYGFLQRLLEMELGVSPLPETQASYQAVLRGPAQPGAPLHFQAELPFIDREEALAGLDRALQRAAAGGGQLVFISGEAGIGKTRLLQQIVEGRLQGAGNQVTAGLATAYPDTQKYPYHLATQALRSLAQPLAGPAGQQVVARLQACLDVVAPLQPARQAPEMLTGWLFELAAVSPVLLAFDNLQWADSNTLDWLLFLSRQIGQNPVLVVGAYNPEISQPLLALRSQLARQGELVELALEGLSPAQLAGLLPDRQRVQQLYRLTGGNPYFLKAYLPLFLAGEPAAVLPVPARLAGFIRLRLERLTPAARQVLYAGAVLPEGFSFTQVQSVAGQGEGVTLDGLDELLNRQILVEAGPHYHFRHQAVRQFVQETMSAGRLRLLRKRANRIAAPGLDTQG